MEQGACGLRGVLGVCLRAST